jgi:hypothetical protein
VLHLVVRLVSFQWMKCVTQALETCVLVIVDAKFVS